LMELLGHHPNDYLVTDDRINFTKRGVEEAWLFWSSTRAPNITQ
jgi:hypothetical protein